MSADARLAASLAGRAGDLLLAIRDGGAGSGPGSEPGLSDPAELGRRGDRESNDLILAALAEQRPGDAVLSEESADDPGRATAARVWIVDPLDGTREFTMPGRRDWAVHVALWERGEGITAAAVAEPALGMVYSSDGVTPAAAPTPVPRRRPVILVSDTRPPAFAGALARRLDAVVAPMGSAGAKAMAVLRGEADAYVHAGGQWEWDSAAPVGVALAGGLHASRLDGKPLEYNQSRPYVPDLVVCRRDLAAAIVEAVAALTL